MPILILDFMNAMHRAHCGYTKGDHAVTYNFFRGFKATVDQFKPTRVYVVGEGTPVHRKEAFSDYKANRIVAADDPRAEELRQFYRQVDDVRDVLAKAFPVSYVRHPDFEVDDTVANLITRS